MITRQFRDNYYLEKSNSHELQDKVNYLMMRHDFINPIYLPSMSEQFLRRDFNFATYLAFCYSNLLKKFFNISLINMIIILVVLDLMKEFPCRG